MSKNKTGDVEELICRAILNDSLREGTPIPSETMLCERAGVSRITVRRAVANLVETGVLYTEHGRGSFVKSFSRTREIYQKGNLFRNIGLYMPRNGYFMNAFYGIESAVRNAGFRIFVSSVATTAKCCRDHADAIRKEYESNLDGLILMPRETAPYPQEYLDLFREIPNLVLFNSSSPEEPVASVSSNDMDGMLQVMRYLISLGHRRIAFFYGMEKTQTNQIRLAAYRTGLAECPECEPEILIHCEDEYTMDSLYGTVKEYMLHCGTPPTAIVCATDKLAIPVYRILGESGLKIPGDISVTGFGNVPEITCMLTPALTSVEQYPEEQGRLAGELLLSLIFKQNITEKQISLATNLHIRNSCALAKKQ